MSNPSAETNRYPPQAGTWTLTAPDGRKWEGKTPLDVVRQENAERVPATVRLQRLHQGIHEWLEQGIRLRNEGDYIIVEVEHDKRFIEVIRDYHPDKGPICHIVEIGGINAAILKAVPYYDQRPATYSSDGLIP